MKIAKLLPTKFTLNCMQIPTKLQKTFFALYFSWSKPVYWIGRRWNRKYFSVWHSFIFYRLFSCSLRFWTKMCVSSSGGADLCVYVCTSSSVNYLKDCVRVSNWQLLTILWYCHCNQSFLCYIHNSFYRIFVRISTLCEKFLSKLSWVVSLCSCVFVWVCGRSKVVG